MQITLIASKEGQNDNKIFIALHNEPTMTEYKQQETKLLLYTLICGHNLNYNCCIIVWKYTV